MKRFVTLILPLCFMLQIQAAAGMVLPVTFGDGMVLQREMPIRIFGTASENASITVQFNGHEETAISHNGTWMLTLEAMPAGGPYELHISGDDDEIVFKDVMLGEVWLAGGQSNMAHHLAGTLGFEKYLPVEENPELRFLHVPVTEFDGIDRELAKWKYFDPASVRGFSAVSYFFATELQKRLGVTVGIIGSYRGATCNEYWMTPESIHGEPQLKYLFEEYEEEYSKFEDDAAYEAAYEQYLLDLETWEKNGAWTSGCVPFPPVGPKSWQRPSGLYNTMIKPLQPYTIRGCIWYQGEGNSGRFEEFKTLFPAFIEGWRQSWNNPKKPFYFVQLPGFGKGSTWPQFRQAQLHCTQTIEHCGMVVSEGCGDEDDIHPRIKKPIGDRLAIAISAEVYGQDHIPYGPVFKSVDFQDGKAKISFDYSAGGLALRSEDSESFEIAGADRAFTRAQSALKGGGLLLWSDETKVPKYVRYAYSPNPDMVLFNQQGLPASPFTTESGEAGKFDLVEIERSRILKKAAIYLDEAPRTVTANQCQRSAGGLHDYYSEGDYWWLDPENPDGPYIRRDGETNPDNFIAHRESMIRLSEIIGTLTSAYLTTNEQKYAEHAVMHLKAWFVDEKTKMNPNLLYGQAIKGRHTGRSTGIIDTLHLVEVAQGAKLLCASPSFPVKDQAKVKAWFRKYLTWMNTHEYGKKEKEHNSNHGVCWSLQAATFADFVGDEEIQKWIRNQFKTVYLGKMMDEKGGFTNELRRTKPYGYSLFMIDAMAGVAHVASTAEDDLWSFELPDGRSMKLGMEFIVPYVKDKSTWPLKPDVMYWDKWPVRHPSLLFAGIEFKNPDYLQTWQGLEADPKTFEVLRNLPLRHPLLWVMPVEAGIR